MEATKVIIEPVLTEKANVLRETQNKYVFRVDARVNKLQVIAAVKELFSVEPVDCNIVNVKGKPRRVRYRMGKTSSWKKAIITLPEGQKIDIFETA
ncbi:50S ribosomal protein L23 [Spirochaetia bacterium 38H-sp]|uniref:Large ribosomal subunit protein uL23 n=1 Tax=Rarispira pelagica TaxID=3141764 RepID=A0ABU9UDG9_9SPIR